MTESSDMDIIEDKEVIARNEHYCTLCGCKIEVGQIYIKQRCVDDGEFFGSKTHIECATLASNLGMYDGCDDTLTSETFKWYIGEYMGENWSNTDSRNNASPYEQVKAICDELKIDCKAKWIKG